MENKASTEPKPVCEKLQYLIGVPSKYINNFDTFNKTSILAETRKLCGLRSIIIANFTDIYEQFRNQVQLADIELTSRFVNDLAKFNIEIRNLGSLSRNVMQLNELIDARIQKIVYGIKGIPQEWIKELFHMPNGDEVDGVRAAVRKYRQYRNFYPYQKYINWSFAETPEEQRSKNIFGNDRELHELLADFHRPKFTRLMDFIGTAKDVIAVVDCENSDAQRLYDALDAIKGNLRKIVLVDDTHTNLMWDELVREYREAGVPIEHDELPRLKEQKSLVDLRMVAKTCEEFYKNHVEHFVLVTSDSDIWALISSLPDADIMVLAERCKSGDLLIEALTQNHIPLVFMEDITEESTLLMDRIVRREIAKRMQNPYVNAKEMVSKVLRELNLFLDTDTFYEYVNEAVGEIVPDEDIGKERIIVMSE